MALKHRNVLDILQNKRTNGISVYSNINSHYSELNLFRHQIEVETTGPSHLPYTAKKASVRTYQILFFSLSALYFTLGLMIYFKTFNWTYSFLFGNLSIALKTLMGSLCTVASATTFSLGFKLRAEKEASKSLYRRAKLRLKQTYHRKMTKFGLNRYLAIGEERKKVLSFRQMYQDALEKLQEQKEEASHLVERIARSPTLDFEKRERLLNQAILEMHDKMGLVVDNFKSANHKRLLSSN